MTMEERKEMPFGKKEKVGNFEYYKITKSLSKKELNTLRNMTDVPFDVHKHLSRGVLTYMVVNTVGGGWSLRFVIGSTMYAFIEAEWSRGEAGANALRNMFTMMYTDTTVMGDNEYWKAKSEALRALMERKGLSEKEGGE